MSSSEYFYDSYGNNHSFYSSGYGAGRILEDGEQPPTRAPMALTDYLVHKKQGRKRARPSQQLETLSESDDTDLAPRDDTAPKTELPSFATNQFHFADLIQRGLSAPNRYLFDYSREGALDALFEFPSKSKESEGQFRYATHSNGDLSVFQWSTFPDLAWKHIGRIDSSQGPKYSEFTSQLLTSDNCKDRDGRIDSRLVQHYTVAMVNQLSRGLAPAQNAFVPTGPSSPLSREINRKLRMMPKLDSNENFPQLSTPKTAIPANTSQSPAGSGVPKSDTITAQEASERRKALIEERAATRDGADPFVANTIPTPTHRPQPRQNFPLEQNKEWKEQQERFKQELRSSNTPGRNVLATPFTLPREHHGDVHFRPAAPSLSDYSRNPYDRTRSAYQIEEAFTRRLSNNVPQYPPPASSMATPTTQLSSEPGPAVSNADNHSARFSHPDTGNRPLAARDLEIPLPRSMNFETLRNHYPLRPDMPTRPWFGNDRLHVDKEPASKQELAKSMSDYQQNKNIEYVGKLESFWDSGKKEIPRQDGLIKHTLAAAGQSHDNNARRALFLFTPACENLEYYAKLPMHKTDEGGYKRKGDSFSKFAAQSWLLDRQYETGTVEKKRNTLQATLDNEPIKSYWQGDKGKQSVVNRARLGDNKQSSIPSERRAISNGTTNTRTASISTSTTGSMLSQPEGVRLPSVPGTTASVGPIGARTGAASTASHRAPPYPPPPPQRGMGAYGF